MCADEGKVARNKEAISFMAHKKEKHTHSPRAHGWIISGRYIGNWQECLLLGRGTGKLVWEENLNFTAYSLAPLCMIFIFQEKNKLNFFFKFNDIKFSREGKEADYLRGVCLFCR